MNKFNTILTVFLTFVLALGIVLLDKSDDVYYEAQDVYRVYLDGESIGLIESREEFQNYINKEQVGIKEQYNVKVVYQPNNLKIEKEVTYNEKISSVEEIYNKIANERAFTIDGYIVTIKKEKEDLELYLLDKNVLVDAINATVRAFVDDAKYDAYLMEQQQEILDEGTIIENVYIAEEITVKKGRVPVNEQIFYDRELSAVKELTKFLIFGNLDKQKTYRCKSGDTLESIAEAHRLNIKELLVANSDLSGEDALLYEGQQLVVNLINPEITVMEVTHEVVKQNIKYDTIEEKDSSMYVGQSKVVKKGKNGVEKVTKKVQRKNGFIVSAVGVSTETLKEPVDKIVKVGTKKYSYSGSYTGPIHYIAPDGYWAWPMKSGWCETTPYGERRSYEIHWALDLSCTGRGSPIYAIQGGTVTKLVSGMGNTSYVSFGNYVEINHGNGFTSLYAHLDRVNVSVGQVVSKKQVIGTMGNSGLSTGPHLHFVVEKNGSPINPYSLYK